jgi:type II secretory pathway component GspD/PulD (secretin)
MSPNTQSLLQFITRTEDGRELVTAALKEAVLITPDARMNSLIVSGPVDYMGLIEQIINKLDTSSPQAAKIKVFALQNADATQMSQLIMQLFRMQQAAQAAGQRSIQYTLMRSSPSAPGAPSEEEELATATLGSAEQSALTVTVDPRTNSLLVGGTDHYVEMVTRIIESLDSSPAQERKTEIYRLRNAQATEVSTALRSFLDQERTRITQVLGAEAVGTAQRLLDREVALVAEPVSNTLLVSANPRYFDEVRKLIEEIDQPQPQVLIQLLLAEVTLDSVNDLGIEWKMSGTVEDHEVSSATDFGIKRQLAEFGGFSTAVTGDNVNFLLRALQNDGRLEVLSRPQILTADNKAATINVGQRVPIITDSRITTQDTTINSYRYEEVGVTLTVTPRIGRDGFVNMEVGTTNSTMASSRVAVSTGLSLPVFNQRRANTVVTVPSGQTCVIGGLIGTMDDVRTKRVPFFGDIPYLGALFRSQTKSRERRELLIFLTPQVMVNNGTPGVNMDASTLLERETHNSSIKTEITRDPLQLQLLDPVFPDLKTNVLDSGKSTKPGKLKTVNDLK